MAMPTQDELAHMLWTNGFGDDALRNWIMGGFLLEYEGFHRLSTQPRERITALEGDTEALDEARRSWVRAMAELLWDASYRLGVSSDSPLTNWHIAETLWEHFVRD